jgi:hypothetical protein
MLTSRIASWPDAETRPLMTYATLVVSVVPLVLVLLDFVAERRAVFGYKGFTVDFSKIDLTESHVRRDAVLLPDNIGQPGAIVTDSSPMEIVAVLGDVTRHEVARVDLGSGDSWWTTRLLALAAGAVRVGAPKALVFLGRRYNVESTFLAWLTPDAVLNALLDANPQYLEAYGEAQTATAQLVTYRRDPPMPPPLPIDGRYLTDPRYTSLGPAAFEQILLDRLVLKGMEAEPERLTLARFQELFEPFAYRDAIDLEWPGDRRVAALLESSAEFVAVTRGGRYESIVQRSVADRLILRELVRQTQQPV